MKLDTFIPTYTGKTVDTASEASFVPLVAFPTPTARTMISLSGTAINTSLKQKCPLSVPRVMQILMIFAGHYLQVFRSIIVSNAINVMDNFISIKYTTKHLFHNQTMLRDAAVDSFWMIRSIYGNIAIGIFNSPTLPMPVVRTLMPSSEAYTRAKLSFTTSEILKLLSALQTTCMGFARNIVTFTATTFRFIRRWPLKFNSANLTYKFHTGILSDTV